MKPIETQNKDLLVSDLVIGSAVRYNSENDIYNFALFEVIEIDTLRNKFKLRSVYRIIEEDEENFSRNAYISCGIEEIMPIQIKDYYSMKSQGFENIDGKKYHVTKFSNKSKLLFLDNYETNEVMYKEDQNIRFNYVHKLQLFVKSMGESIKI